MKQFDLNLLRVAVALYDARSVSRAAQQLGMSQPAVSAALARLRRAFSDPLFVKTGQGMSPTARTHALVAGAREALARIATDVLADTAFDPATTRDTFTLALSDVGEMVFLPRILDSVRRLAPGAAIRSVAPAPTQLEHGLESGEIDLAIGYFPDLKSGAYFQQRLLTHRFVCLLRADHPIRGPRLSLDQFLALGHAVVRAEGRSQEIFEKHLARRRIARRIVLSTPHFMSIPTIIAKTDLIVTLPHAIGLFFAQAGARIRIVEPPLAIPRIDLRQHWHRHYHHDARNRWLRRLVATLFNDASDEWPYPF